MLIYLLVGILTLWILPCVKGQGLTPESVSEGPCISNLGDKAPTNGSLLWIATPRNYYVPIASEHCFRSYAQTLLGRPAQTQEELDSMKLRIKLWLPLPPVFLSYGFYDSASTSNRKFIQQTCPPARSNPRNQVLCLPLEGFGSRGADYSGIKTSLDTAYYTDNKTTLLIIRCLNDKVKDYKVLTTGPTVSPEMMAILRDRITELGFDVNLMRIKSY